MVPPAHGTPTVKRWSFDVRRWSLSQATDINVFQTTESLRCQAAISTEVRLEGMNPLQASFKLKWTCVRTSELITAIFRLLFQETLETSYAYRLPFKVHGLDHVFEDCLVVNGRHLLRRVVLFPPGA